ncbi:MAG: rod shape-determining protein RodA [Candidatus Lambdaproteobacteria bacterium]|nr:rod shape-determining protein RodA [Candidatus Lambdaproteobacteria bacterium]
MFDRRLLSNFDWVLFLLVLVIALIGVSAIYSASAGYTEAANYWLRQLYWLAAGLGVGFFVLLVDFRSIGRWAYPLHAVAILSLVLVMFYGTGSDSAQVNRWFMVGSVAVQPSEFVKFTTVLAIAYYFRDSRRIGSVGWRVLLLPVAMVALPFALIVQQPDLGTAIMLVLIFVPMVVLAGLRTRIMLVMAGGGLVAIGLLIVAFRFGVYQLDEQAVLTARRSGADPAAVQLVSAARGERFYLQTALHARLTEILDKPSEAPLVEAIEGNAFKPYISYLLRPYQQKRLVTFINPDRDPLGAGYHVIQSKVAIGSGRFLGKGFLGSTQGSLNFLPARHTDFLFSIFAEEWGFLGAFTLLLLYTLLIVRGMTIVLQTQDRFGAFLALGIVSILIMQVLTNVAMAVGLLPVVGVPLPLFSYGGSSMVSVMLGVALILNIRMRRFLWV